MTPSYYKGKKTQQKIVAHIVEKLKKWRFHNGKEHKEIGIELQAMNKQRC